MIMIMMIMIMMIMMMPKSGGRTIRYGGGHVRL